MKAQNEAVELVQVPQERLAGMEPQMRDLGKGRPLLGVFFIFASIAGLACGLGQVGLPDAKVDPYKKAPIHHAPVRPNHAGKKRKEVLADGHLGTKGENGELKVEAGAEPDGPPLKIIHTIGRLEYREGFKDVWVDDVPFDLRPHIKARLCLEYLEKMQAVDANSARHFLDEIDLYVRETGGLDARGKFSEIKIQDYFREPSGRLIKLCQAMIRSAGNGKYYLETGDMKC